MNEKRRREIEEEERYRTDVRARLAQEGKEEAQPPVRESEPSQRPVEHQSPRTASKEAKRGGGCLRTVGWLVLGFLILVFIASITNPDSPGRDTSESTVQPTAQENAPAARAPALETQDGEITKQEYGEDWPFSIESGYLYCDGPGSNVVMRSGGTVYALNGRAMGNAEEHGYVIAKDAIQLTDEAGYYTVGSITKIIERGLAMC